MNDINELREELARQDKLIKRLLLCVSDMLCSPNGILRSANDHEINRLAYIVRRGGDFSKRTIPSILRGPVDTEEVVND